MKNNKKNIYKSPISVGRRQTLFFNSKDPRANGDISNIDGTNALSPETEKYRAKIGSDIIIKPGADPIDLDTYILQCIYDTAEVRTFSIISANTVLDTIILNGAQYFTDEVSILLLDIDLINVEDAIVLDETQYFSDSLNVSVPTELFEILVSDNIIAEGSIIGDGTTTLSDIFGLLYAITYDGNGRDEGSAPFDPISYPSGSNVTVLDSGSLIKYGYIFAGWNTKIDGSGTTYQPGDQIIGISDFITVYAVWINVYNVTYYGNGNDEGVIPVDTNLYFNGDIVTIVGQGTLVKYGKIFDGWNTQENGTGTTYQLGDTVTISEANINLYAKWI